MKVICGIIKPNSGRIYFNGQDITDWSITDRANLGISYAFQKPVAFKGLKVIDLLTLASGKGTSSAKPAIISARSASAPVIISTASSTTAFPAAK